MSVLLIVFALAALAVFCMLALFFKGDQASMMQSLPFMASAVFASLTVIVYVIFRMDRQFRFELPDRRMKAGLEEKIVSLVSGAFREYYFEYDCGKDDILFSDKYAETFGSPASRRGFKASLEQIREVYPSDIQRIRELLGQPGGREQVRTLELRLILPDEHFEWYRAGTVTVDSENGKKIAGKLVNIDKEKRDRERLVEKANTDALTGLYNRAVMQQKVEQFLAYRDSEANGAFFIVDADNFKDVNDNLGHSMGDLVLKDIAGVLRDIFPDNSVISRMGGDEYAIFCGSVGSADVIRQKAEYIRSRLHKVYSYKGKDRLVTVSVGAALTNDGDKLFNPVYERADKALYLAKIKGKNRLELFSETDETEQVKKYEAFPEWGIF